jgi:hypothetical protein
MADLLPARALAQVPTGHPLLKLGRPLGKVRYTRAVLEEHPGLTAPSLEHIELDGRAVVVYTKYNFSSAIAGHPCRCCPAVLEPSASELMLKVVLYSLAN